VFEPLHLERSWTLATYRTIGGYQVWERLMRDSRRASRSSMR